VRSQPAIGRLMRPQRILRVRIVVDKLGEVSKDVDLEFPRFGRGSGDGQSFIVLRVGLLGLGQTTVAKAKSKGMLPLLGRPFRIDVSVPNHQCRYKWVWHFAAG